MKVTVVGDCVTIALNLDEVHAVTHALGIGCAWIKTALTNAPSTSIPPAGKKNLDTATLLGNQLDIAVRKIHEGNSYPVRDNARPS